MKKIIVSVTNDVANDQRVSKVCDTLYNLKYDVSLVGRKLSNSKNLKRHYPIKRFKLLFNKGVLFYIEFNIRLFFYLLFSKSDILLANDLDTLLPNFIVSRIKNKELVYDSHELFPEIPELLQRPFKKKIWKTLEKILLPYLKNCYTVSDSIAHYYKEEYNTHFNVVRNIPILSKTKTRNFTKVPFKITKKKIVLYQGAVNVGRGIELMIEAIDILTDCYFLIIGHGDIFEEINKLVSQKNLNNKVYFLGKIAPQELKDITPLAHVGISIEEDLGLSYRYSLPNKIFDYIHAQIPVITSNLPEMKKIVHQYKIGEVLEERTPERLAEKIEYILNKNYSANLKNAKKELTWGNEEIIIKRIFNSFE